MVLNPTPLKLTDREGIWTMKKKKLDQVTKDWSHISLAAITFKNCDSLEYTF
jgi:hypothetical protein